MHKEVKQVLKVLADIADIADIADAYDANELDDNARKNWGPYMERVNHTPHNEIELYQGRGGKRLLTLQDCMDARDLLRKDF